MRFTTSKKNPGKRHSWVNMLILTLVLLYLITPLGATMVFGLASRNGVLYTYQQIFRDPDFWGTLRISLELAGVSTLATTILVTTTAYWVHLHLPQARPLMDVLTLMPLAVPAIVLSLGLSEVYGTPNILASIVSLGLVPLLSADPLTIVNTPQLLVCAYVIIALPFAYRAIDNSLRAINTKMLTEAAYSLGGGWWRTFLTVVLPNIWPGVLSAAILTFSTTMGEFTMASLFGIFTFPIYLDETGQNDPHKAASLAILSFLLTLISVLAIIFLVRLGPKHSNRDESFEITAAK